MLDDSCINFFHSPRIQTWFFCCNPRRLYGGQLVHLANGWMVHFEPDVQLAGFSRSVGRSRSRRWACMDELHRPLQQEHRRGHFARRFRSCRLALVRFHHPRFSDFVDRMSQRPRTSSRKQYSKSENLKVQEDSVTLSPRYSFRKKVWVDQ